MKSLLTRFLYEDDGQDLVEYAFLAVFLSLGTLTALRGVSSSMNVQFSNISTKVTSGS